MASVALAGSGFLEPASRDSQVSHVQPRAVVAQVQNLLRNPLSSCVAVPSSLCTVLHVCLSRVSTSRGCTGPAQRFVTGLRVECSSSVVARRQLQVSKSCDEISKDVRTAEQGHRQSVERDAHSLTEAPVNVTVWTDTARWAHVDPRMSPLTIPGPTM